MHKVVCALDHGVLDPFGRAHQVLHTLVHEDLILSREGALLILQHCFLPARNGFSTALLFLRELRVTASRLLVLVLSHSGVLFPAKSLKVSFSKKFLMMCIMSGQMSQTMSKWWRKDKGHERLIPVSCRTWYFLNPW